MMLDLGEGILSVYQNGRRVGPSKTDWQANTAGLPGFGAKAMYQFNEASGIQRRSYKSNALTADELRERQNCHLCFDFTFRNPNPNTSCPDSMVA